MAQPLDWDSFSAAHAGESRYGYEKRHRKGGGVLQERLCRAITHQLAQFSSDDKQRLDRYMRLL